MPCLDARPPDGDTRHRNREQGECANAGGRIGDSVIYWLAYLHFGRINGIGIPCRGPGLCDQTTKAIWALFGLAPAAMFVTGTILWWNRVLRPRLARTRRAGRSPAVTAL